jgi:Saxitoxin biosynthesis operon protein SxtJ
MAERIPARLTAAAGRRFGTTVGLAFSVLAAIAWWRGHPTTTTILGGLGGTLLVAGLVIPTYLGPVERAWMGLAHAISKVTTPIVMGAMYLLVFTPVGWIRRITGGNPMVHAEVDHSYWRSRAEGARRSSLERQY